MIKVKHVKTVKPVAPPESGIGTMSFSAERYSLYEDRETRRCVVVKEGTHPEREGADAEQIPWTPLGIPFENVERIEYYSTRDAGLPSNDEPGQEVRRGPGRPPKQHVLA